jgi:transposase-like protein
MGTVPRYPDSYKAQAMRLAITLGSVSRAAREARVSRQVIYKWAAEWYPGGIRKFSRAITAARRRRIAREVWLTRTIPHRGPGTDAAGRR